MDTFDQDRDGINFVNALSSNLIILRTPTTCSGIKKY